MKGRIVRAQLRRRPGTTVTFFLLGTLLGLGVVAPAAARLSAQHAVGDSLLADLGGRAFAFQTGDPQVAAVVATVDGVSPVVDDAGAVSDATGSLRIGATLRLTDDPGLELGVLTSGARPAEPGDALLSESVAQAIGARAGDRVTVHASTGELAVTITGLTVDPADISTRTAVVLLDPGACSAATRWLSDTPFHEVAVLERPLEERQASIQSARRLVESAERAQPAFVGALRWLPLGAGLAVSVVIVAFAAMRARRWSVDVERLAAAGMAYGPAWRTLLDGALLSTIGGVAAGAGLSLAVTSAVRTQVSAWFGQRWVSFQIPWFTLLALVVSVVAVAVAVRHPPRGVWFWALAALERARHAGRGQARMPWAVLAVALCLWGLLLFWAASHDVEAALVLLPVPAAVAVAAVPFALAPVLRTGLGPALRALSRALSSGLAAVTAAAAVVALLSGVWAAQQHGDANSGERISSPLQPAGSFVIDQLPDDVLPTLRRLYGAAGGRELVSWRLPDESRTQLRVTSPSLVRCLQRSGTDRPNALPEECWPEDAAAPVNTMAIGAPGSAASADPHLAEAGRVGLFLFEAGGGNVVRSATTPATADPLLGGLVPGLVVALDGDLAAEYGLRPGGMSEVALLDFARLDPRARLAVRAEVARLAPAAQTADGTDPTAYDRLRSVADLAALLGGAATFVLLLLGTSATATAHASTRRVLVELGGTPRLRLVMVARWLAVPLVTGAFTAAATLLTASYGLHRPVADLGVAWIVPSALLGVVTLVAVPAFLRVPAPDSE